MIKYVTKRDGSVEDFNVEKLNKWADWAAEECGVSWTDIVLDASQYFSNYMDTAGIQDLLISECINRKDTGHTKMAARLMVGKIYKEAYSDYSIPHLKDFYHEAVEEGWWEDLGYTDEELDELDKHIDHTKDFTYTYAALRQMYDKYLVDVGRKVESPQFMFMGISMALMQQEPDRINTVIKEYTLLSDLKQSLPTPTLNGMRTPLQGSPSCCVISGGDTAKSIGAALHLAYSYTAARSGIGIEFDTRGPKEPVKGGRVEHGGKYSIYKTLQSSVGCLTQVTRGGSATVTYTCLDPEVLSLLTMKQQRTSDQYRLDHLDYSLAVNNLFLRKVAKNEDWMLVSSYFAPKLHHLFYSGDEQAFENEYEKVKATQSNSKWVKFVKARDIILQFIESRSDTGRNYITFMDNVNQHTPFKEPIRLSNLCQEILLPTKPYKDIFSLDKEDYDGETALCFIAAHVIGDYSNEDWEELAYYTAKSVDNTIELSVYPFKHVEWTAKKRRSIGIGLTGLGSWLAKHGLKYDTEEGRNAIHRIAETHSYYLHKASVRLAKERGACEWFDKTKYSEGWLPIDTYKKEVDKFHTQDLIHDWEALRKDIMKYGMRFSVLEAFMPCESSSLLNNGTNSILPARQKDLFKQSRKGNVYWQVPGMDEYLDNYQWSWDIESTDLAKVYGIFQKFCGQSISADFYHDYTKNSSVSANEMLKLVLLSAKLGMKTWYYLNFNTGSKNDAEISVTIESEEDCESCKL